MPKKNGSVVYVRYWLRATQATASVASARPLLHWQDRVGTFNHDRVNADITG